MLKLYLVTCDTSINGKFYKRGEQVQILGECSNVNFKFIKDLNEEKKETKKVSKK